MKRVYHTVSAAGLLLTVLPAVLVANGVLPWHQHVVWMAAGTACWFVTAPLWMRRAGQRRAD